MESISGVNFYLFREKTAFADGYSQKAESFIFLSAFAKASADKSIPFVRDIPI